MGVLISLVMIFVVTLIIDLKFKIKTKEWFWDHHKFYTLYKINYFINVLSIFPIVIVGMVWVMNFLNF